MNVLTADFSLSHTYMHMHTHTHHTHSHMCTHMRCSSALYFNCNSLLQKRFNKSPIIVFSLDKEIKCFSLQRDKAFVWSFSHSNCSCFLSPWHNDWDINLATRIFQTLCSWMLGKKQIHISSPVFISCLPLVCKCYVLAYMYYISSAEGFNSKCVNTSIGSPRHNLRTNVLSHAVQYQGRRKV